MVARMNYEELSSQLMPNLYNLTDLASEECEYNEEGYFTYPPLLNLSFESLSNEEAILLLDDGFRLYLYIGAGVNKKAIKSLFGKNQLSEVANPLDTEEVNSFLVQNPVFVGGDTMSNKVQALVTDLRAKRTAGWSDLVVVSPGHVKCEFEDE